MKRTQSLLVTLFVVFLLIPVSSHAERLFKRAVVFGDSLSDPGNAYILGGRHLKPPYQTLDAFLIPDAPYARGGNHFSNGKTWIEQLAAPLGMEGSVGPAFSGVNRGKLKRSNYAVGGARAYDDGNNVNLTDQVNAFFADTGATAPTDALYVIAVGGNDVRDALGALSIDPTGAISAQLISGSLGAISDNILSLYGAGARSFLIANSPDLSLTPAIQRLDLVSPGAGFAAAILTAQFNAALDALLDQLTINLPGLTVARLDLMGILHGIIDDPSASGLKNVTDACVRPMQSPSACRKPKAYLFWDGIHPTKAAHRILSKQAKEILTQSFPTITCRGKHKHSANGCKIVQAE